MLCWQSFAPKKIELHLHTDWFPSITLLPALLTGMVNLTGMLTTGSNITNLRACTVVWVQTVMHDGHKRYIQDIWQHRNTGDWPEGVSPCWMLLENLEN